MFADVPFHYFFTWRTLMTVHGMHREASIEINASPEVVYDLVSDLPRMGEWSPENVGGEWQDGGSGKVGNRSRHRHHARRAESDRRGVTGSLDKRLEEMPD